MPEPSASPTTEQQQPPSYPVRRLQGRVEAVNKRGIRIAGEWLNFSTFHPVTEPAVGQLVELWRSGRWIRQLTVKPELLSATPAQDDGPSSLPPTLAAAPPGPPISIHNRSPREHRLRRLAVLRAAVLFHATHPLRTDQDVLATAERFLAWLEEADGDPSLELDGMEQLDRYLESRGEHGEPTEEKV